MSSFLALLEHDEPGDALLGQQTGFATWHNQQSMDLTETFRAIAPGVVALGADEGAGTCWFAATLTADLRNRVRGGFLRHRRDQ